MTGDEDDDAVVVCANAECRVAETGRCVEGLGLEVCPQYGREPERREAAEQSDVPVFSGIRLASASQISAESASQYLRHTPARVIAIIGPSDSGKTSLIAGLYELFQTGSAGNVAFARSYTLHAFEQACHDARAASRRSVPHINRTPIGEVSFYHLEVVSETATDGLCLLLADRAGEEYREASDDSAAADRFVEVKRSDSLTVLVDGRKIIGQDRHNLRQDILMMLQGLKEGGALSAQARVAVVLTKLDEVRGSGNSERAIRDFETLLDQVRSRFEADVASIQGFHVAASPKSGIVARGSGLPELLTFWLGRSEVEAGNKSKEDENFVSDRLFLELGPSGANRDV